MPNKCAVAHLRYPDADSINAALIAITGVQNNVELNCINLLCNRS